MLSGMSVKELVSRKYEDISKGLKAPTVVAAFILKNRET